MTYSLWQSFDRLPADWQPVTGAEVQIDGATVTLIDPGPPSNQVYYQVRAVQTMGSH